jgi:hypothetical protein
MTQSLHQSRTKFARDHHIVGTKLSPSSFEIDCLQVQNSLVPTPKMRILPPFSRPEECARSPVGTNFDVKGGGHGNK